MLSSITTIANQLYRKGYLGVNYRLRTFAGGRYASTCRPTDIVFLLTEFCNARCVHCDIWKNKGRGRENVLTVDRLKETLSEIRSWLGPVQVTFSGGEALLRPYTPEVIAHGSSIGLSIEVLTHGYWDDQSRIEKLAMANPNRVTVSLDAIGDTHSRIRGRDRFFEKTTTTIDTLKRIRKEHNLDFVIRLKTVIMEQNLEEVHKVAEFANQPGMHVFYQPIEQNYNTPDDPVWFEHSENWPQDSAKAVRVVEHLIDLKRRGLPIDNNDAQLEVMKTYFLNPESSRVTVQAHSAHERRAVCTALTFMQIQPNGDVMSCCSSPVIGNLNSTSIREIWSKRPHWWENGCCLERRCGEAEKEHLHLVSSIAGAGEMKDSGGVPQGKF